MNKPKRVLEQERLFTLTTRINKNQMDYFEEYRKTYCLICRRIWQDLKHNKITPTQSKYISSLMKRYNVSKRTINSAFSQMKGRKRALDELHKTQAKNIEIKLTELSKKIEKEKLRVNKLKKFVVNDCNNTKLVHRYKNKKARLYRLQRKYNEYKQSLSNYDKGLWDGDLCFGSKSLFDKQNRLEENGFRNHDHWYKAFVNARDSQVYYLGSSDETKGNQMFQLITKGKDDKVILKIRKELAYSKDTEKYIYLETDFKYKKDLLLRVVENGAVTYDVIKKGNKWYIETKFKFKYAVETDRKNGCVGIDFNDGFLAISETDTKGNLVDTYNIKFEKKGVSNKARSEMSDKLSKLIRYTRSVEKALCIEDLDFQRKKAKQIEKINKNYNKMLHTLETSRFKHMCSDYCAMYGVGLYKVNPCYTTQIGKKKYAYTRKLGVHNASAYVIARRGQGYKDVV